MLDYPFGWYGKLPTQAEFIYSKQDINIVNYFKDWFFYGNNHVGERLINISHQQERVIYFFKLSEKIFHIPIQGIIFSSYDIQMREYPFVLFDKKMMDSEKLIMLSQQLFHIEFQFKLENIFTNLVEELLWKDLKEQIEQYQINLSSLDPSMNYWQQLLVKHKPIQLITSLNTPVIYRKLFIK